MSRPVNVPSGYGMRWVKLKKYCEIAGETENAVRIRRKRGIWRDGKQCIRAPDGTLWVNLEKADLWVEKT